MSQLVRIEKTEVVEIELDTKAAATWFCGLSDEEQAQFLIEVQSESARLMDGKAESQWYYMCGHLKTCDCSNEDTREMIRTWGYYLEDRKP